jgi:hypothetical protein
MSGELPAVHGIPTSVSFGLGFETRADPVAGQHAVRFELEKVLDCNILGSLEGPSQKSYLVKRKRPRLEGHLLESLHIKIPALRERVTLKNQNQGQDRKIQCSHGNLRNYRE